MLTLEEVKNYLKVDYTEDDNYLEFLISTSRGYIEDGVTNYKSKVLSKKFQQKVKFVQLAIIQQMYDERYLMGDHYTMNYIVRAMFLQLDYGDYSEI